MSNFKLEPRYAVLKLSDILALRHSGVISAAELATFHEIEMKVHKDRLAKGRGPLDALVIEKDWPEYAPTLKAIENRVNGTPLATELNHGQIAAESITPSQPEAYHYLISWSSSSGRVGCSEVGLPDEWAFGDMDKILDLIAEHNPACGKIAVTGALKIAAPRKESPENAPV